MKSSHFTLPTRNNTNLFIYNWMPDNPFDLKAVVLICHGMAEHGGRYERFAEFLTSQGIAVYANDHRGHGKTAGDLKNVGYFADKEGWFHVTGDVYLVVESIRLILPGIPVFILGHSMGSFLARTLTIIVNNPVDGLILSGTSGTPGIMGKVGKMLAKLLLPILGKKTPSKLFNQLSFGEFNKPFKPNRTEFDWLSRDNAQVDKYVADPYCGGIFSLKFFEDLLTGVLFINQQKNINKMNKDIPVYFFSGEKDPVGNFTKGVTEVVEKFKIAGIKDVTYKFYKDARHETLNEINREEVYKDIVEWINNHLILTNIPDAKK